MNEGKSFNWLDLLVQQFRTHVNNAKNPPKDKQIIFYMSSYLPDAICAQNSIPCMSWTSSPKEPIVHIYCKFLSECSYKGVIEKLTNNFLIPLYRLIFQEEPPCMSHQVMEVVLELEDWFASLECTFLREFGGHKSPHLLPRYATNKLVMQEVAYHLSTRLSRLLHRKKKAPWLVLSLQIGLYEIENLKVADTKGKEIDKFAFVHLDLNLYNHKNVCKEHCVRIHFRCPSETSCRLEEEEIKNYYNASKSN